MKEYQVNTSTIDEFIALFPPEVQEKLNRIRAIIREEAPGAAETIAYGIPTFVLHGNLVHFSAYKEHIGFYPAPSGIEHFKDELALYQKGKGTLQFPLNQPIPFDLIRRVVACRVQQNLAKAASKKKKK
jgi:uncharacterized protein YdhG (YjbR/CyaY superfamily)